MKSKINSIPAARSVSSEVRDTDPCPFFGQIFRSSGMTNGGDGWDRIFKVIGPGYSRDDLKVEILWTDEHGEEEVGSVIYHARPDLSDSERISSLEEVALLGAVTPNETALFKRANPDWTYSAAYW